MSKLETIQAFSDSGLPTLQLRAVVQLQSQFAEMTQQMDLLGQTLTDWSQQSQSISQQQSRSMLDIAAIMKPIESMLIAMQQRQMKQEALLSRLEQSLHRVTQALPNQVAGQDGRGPVQPRLASKRDLAGLPSEIWAAKPGIFDKR